MSIPLRNLLSPEARLLLLTAGGRGNDAAIAAAARGALDWRRLTRLAESERAEPVFVRRLREVLGAGLPPEAERLEQLARVADFRQCWIEERLVASLRLLQRAGIDAVLLKGAALAVSCYPSFLERPMADLDLLVDRDRAEEAHRLLRAGGWAWDHDPELDGFYSTHHHLAPLHDSKGVGVGLDLHTTPVCAGNPFMLDGSLMRQRSTPVSVQGVLAYLPDVHDQLLHLCVHFAWSHLLSSGAWRTFRDIGTLVSSGRVDWATFEERARAHRATSCCYWVLRLAGELAGIQVPPAVLREFRPQGGSVFLTALERHFVLHLLPSESLAASVRLTGLMWAAGIQPGRMGHGRARPWDRTAAFKPTVRVASPAAAPTLAGRFQRIRSFGGYTRAMLGAS